MRAAQRRQASRVAVSESSADSGLCLLTPPPQRNVRFKRAPSLSSITLRSPLPAGDGRRKLQIEMGAGGAAYEQAAAARHNLRPAARLDLDPQTRAALERLHRAQQLAAPGGGVLRQIRALPQRERVCYADQTPPGRAFPSPAPRCQVRNIDATRSGLQERR